MLLSNLSDEMFSSVLVLLGGQLGMVQMDLPQLLPHVKISPIFHEEDLSLFFEDICESIRHNGYLVLDQIADIIGAPVPYYEPSKNSLCFPGGENQALSVEISDLLSFTRHFYDDVPVQTLHGRDLFFRSPDFAGMQLDVEGMPQLVLGIPNKKLVPEDPAFTDLCEGAFEITSVPDLFKVAQAFKTPLPLFNLDKHRLALLSCDTQCEWYAPLHISELMDLVAHYNT